MVLIKTIKTYPVTCAVMALLALIYLLMTLAGGSQEEGVLMAFGANYAPAVRNGEYWRLLTCNFLHMGFGHLFLNSVAILSLGGLAESLFRKVKTVMLFLLCGVFSALASFWFSPEESISAGASGVVFGLAGAIILYVWKNPRLRSNGMVSSLAVLVALNLALGFAMDFIDNAAHLGGLISGLVIGGILRVYDVGKS